MSIRRLRTAYRGRVLSTLAAAVLCAFSVSPLAAASLRIVGYPGQPAPGVSSATFRSFPGDPALNDSGQTAFMGRIQGSGIGPANDEGIWSEGSGSLMMLARTQGQAAGLPAGEVYESFLPPVINNSGEIAFNGRLISGGSAIWSDASGSLAPAALEGNQAPGTAAGQVFGDLGSNASRPAMNSSGAAAFFGFLTGPGVTMGVNNTGIWSQGGGSLELVAQRGSQAPGLPAGVNLGSPSSPVPLNDDGQTAFRTSLTGAGINGQNDQVIYVGGVGTLALAARAGNRAPGTPSQVIFNDLSAPSLAAGGRVAFNGTLAGGSSTAANDAGVWAGSAGNVHLVAREGSQAPETLAGVTFVAFDTPSINDAGRAAFVGSLTGLGVVTAPATVGRNDQGIWRESAGSLHLIVRAGDHAPGTPAGVSFHEFTLSTESDAPAINRWGQLAFMANITGPGTLNANSGIWATTLQGELRLIARDGDAIEVSPGDIRTILRLEFFNVGTGDGRQSGFNDLGQVAFKAVFTDASEAVFVSDVVAIPEPGAFVMALGALMAITAMRRR